MGPICSECETYGEVIEVCKDHALSRCPRCGEEWTWEISTLEVTGLTPIDWDSMPKGRNYLYYGRDEMDAFHDTIKLHLLRRTILYMAAIDSLGKAREEVQKERSNTNYSDSVIDDVEAHLETYPDEKDPKYSYNVQMSSVSRKGYHGAFNMVYFLTDLETWETGLRTILEGRQN